MRYLKTIIGILDSYRSRPTRYFVLLTVMIVGLFFLAYMYNHNIVFIVMFSAFSLALGASFIGRRNLFELQASLAKQDRLFANKEFPLCFELSNSASYDRYALFIALDEHESTPLNISQHSTQKLCLKHHALSRGEHLITSVILYSFFPFSHEKFNTKSSIDEEIVIYPEPKGKSLEENFFFTQSHSGEREDFDHLRSYQQSDAMSLIYWPSVAKGEMLTKEFIYEQASHFYALDYDKAGEDHESRLSQLTKWILECERKEADFSVTIDNKTLESKGGVDAILAQLATS